MTSGTITLMTHKGAGVAYPEPKGPAKFNWSPGDGISWASWSWNPATGRLHDCDYCYARELATSTKLEPFYPVGFAPLFHHERLISKAV
jgi:DNA repair photolyase